MYICIGGSTYVPFTYHCKKVFVYGVQTQEYTNGLLFYRVIACISPAVTKCRTANKKFQMDLDKNSPKTGDHGLIICSIIFSK